MLKPRPAWNDCAAACARASVVAVFAVNRGALGFERERLVLLLFLVFAFTDHLVPAERSSISASATLASPALPALNIVAVMISESGSMAIWPCSHQRTFPAARIRESARTPL